MMSPMNEIDFARVVDDADRTGRERGQITRLVVFMTDAEIALANIELGRRCSPARVARFQVQPWAKPPDRP